MDQKALITLWNTTQMHIGTSGARACAGVLLSLYNGARFPFDLTDLRILDSHLRDAAIAVIRSDATYCQHEVHSWLNLLTGRHDFGARFEHLAHDYGAFRKGRCTKAQLSEQAINPPRLVIRLAEQPALAEAA